jgi:hypothetical protein
MKGSHKNMTPDLQLITSLDTEQITRQVRAIRFPIFPVLFRYARKLPPDTLLEQRITLQLIALP